MSDQQPEATPEQQAHVRRLLAKARHTEPLPPEVAQRLDGVLGQLVSEGPRAIDPPPPPGPAPVDELAARRRRRVTGLLAAAAAVVVVGVGIGQLTDLSGGSDSDDSGGADVSSAGSAADEDGAADVPERQPQAPGEVPSQEPSGPPPQLAGARPPNVSADFATDAARLRPRAVVPSAAGTVVTGADLSDDPMFVCDPTPAGPGLLLAVRYDDRPAVLAYRPARGDTQPVELLRCGTGDVLRSTVLPAP
ncbi:hypothetical protein FE634_21190 [Nocardioides dongxiaopingii]|uniref:hypothetical protein n=1 Tax=Nocardioides sp. S-1144 TaxID=2582905 RepID=UPI00110EE08E|nr:hypothetical protein [Nocardioides sp. S-1144]QCW52317.1 hypothetical protein FE634_21190 [Nocardioides sp. S-1144]